MITVIFELLGIEASGIARLFFLLIAILVMLGAPTTPSCYIMAKNMKNDEVLTSSVVVAATLISSVTLTGWIYILKSFGYL